MPLVVSADVVIDICGYSGEEAECPNAAGSGGGSLQTTPGHDLTNSVVGTNPRVKVGTKIDSLGFCSDESGQWKCGTLPMKVGDLRPLPNTAAAGWTNPDTPPSTAPISTCWREAGGGTCFGSWQEAVGNSCSRRGYQVRWDWIPPSVWSARLKTESPYNGNVADVFCYDPNNNPQTQNMFGSTEEKVVTCPAGYSASGGNCSVSTPADVKWPSDGVCTIERNAGNSFRDAPRDSDCTVSTGNAADTLPNPVQRTGTGATTGWSPPQTPNANPGGATGSGPGTSSVKLNSDGTGQVTDIRPNSGGASSTKTDVFFSSPGSDGKSTVTGITQKSIDGVGNGTGLETGAGGAGTTTPTNQGDGAKESTLQGVKNDLEGSADYQGFGTAKTFAESWSEFKQAISGGPLGGMLSFAAPSVSGTCPTFTIPVYGNQLSMESFCDVGTSITTALHAAMIAVWAIVGLKIVFSA